MDKGEIFSYRINNEEFFSKIEENGVVINKDKRNSIHLNKYINESNLDGRIILLPK
jgi:hypothetical protein